jgi:predicted phage terminase large subunit-like protein
LSALADDDDRRRTIRAGLIDWAAGVLAQSGFTPAAHHLLLLAELEAVARTRSGRLIVLMPPGAAKSTYASVIFPAWWFAQHPSSSVIAASHTAGLAEHFSRQVRGLVAEGGSALGTMLQASNRSARNWRLSTGGQYYATGLRGPIAGRRADLIIIDDPVKSRAEADSAGARDLAWNWYRFDLVTRLTPGGRIVLVMTRWHEDDLGGRLLAQNRGEWRVIRLPALSQTSDPLARPLGAPLWPEWEDAPALIRKRDTMGERAWSALFQQSPGPLEGGLFRVERIVYLDRVPELDSSRPVRAWDLAATPKADDNDPDWTVGLKLSRDSGGRFIVLDVVRQRASAWQVEKLLVDTARRDGPNVLVALPQDPGSAGKVVATNYAARLAGFQVSISPESGSKVARATPIAAQVEAGNFAVVRAEWNTALTDELRDFPQGRKDDQVDALSRGFQRLVPQGQPARHLNVSFVAR